MTTTAVSAAVAAATAVNPNWQSSALYKYFDSEDDSPRASWEPQTERIPQHPITPTPPPLLFSPPPQTQQVETSLQPGHLTSPSLLSSVDVEVIVMQPSEKHIFPSPPYSPMHHEEADALLYSVLQAAEQSDVKSDIFETFPTPPSSLVQTAADSAVDTGVAGSATATAHPTGPQLAATSKLYEHLSMATVTARLLAALSPDSVVRKRNLSRGGQAIPRKQASTRQQIVSHMPVILEPAQAESSSTASRVESDDTTAAAAAAAAAVAAAAPAAGNVTSAWSTQLGREFSHRQKSAAIPYKQQNVAQANGHAPPFFRSHGAFSKSDKCFKLPPSPSQITTAPSLEDKLARVETHTHTSTSEKVLPSVVDIPSLAVSQSSLFRQEDLLALDSSRQPISEIHGGDSSSSSARPTPCDNIMTRPLPGQHNLQVSAPTAAPAATAQTMTPGTKKSPRGVPCPRPGLDTKPTHPTRQCAFDSSNLSGEHSATGCVPAASPKQPPLPQTCRAPEVCAATQPEGRSVGTIALSRASTAAAAEGNADPRVSFVDPPRTGYAGDLVMRGARSENEITGSSKLNSLAWDSWGGARARLLQTMLTETPASDNSTHPHSLSAPNNTTLTAARTAFKDTPKSFSSRGTSTEPASSLTTHKVCRSAASASRLSDRTSCKHGPTGTAAPVGTSAAACSGWSGHLSMRTFTWGAVDRRRRSDIDQKMDGGVSLPQRSPHMPCLVSVNRMEQGSGLRVQSGPGCRRLNGPHSVSDRHLRSGRLSVGGVPGQGGYVGSIGKVEEPLVLALSSPKLAEVQA